MSKKDLITEVILEINLTPLTNKVDMADHINLVT